MRLITLSVPLSLACLVVVSQISRAGSPPGPDEAAGAEAIAESPAEREARLQWWREARFGMFIHWGPVSLEGTEIGWSRGREVPADEYDALHRRFNPERFDADAWVAVAQAAGMKYIVITAKHHDGFSLWDSKLTDYDIMATPFGRDVLAELSAACRGHGLRFCTYFSICDWWHPDYPLGSPGGRTEKPNPDMPRYVEYLHGQLREIIESYGPLGILWFDGEWEKPWNAKYGNALYRLVRTLQPDIIVNNRVSRGRAGMEGTTRQDSGNPGDYDTPEQRVGGFNRERPWETCMTICRQWAWKPDDRMKSLAECVQTLLRTVGGDGNFLFNVGPMPDGRIEPRQVERLREMGAWLEKYGAGVYGTRGGPFKPGKWGASTCKGNRIFIYVMRWPYHGPLELPAIDAEMRGSRTLTGGEVEIERGDAGELLVALPAADRDEIATVIELTVDREASEIPPIDIPIRPSGSLALGKQVTASNVFGNQAQHAAAKACDDDPETRWATDAGTHSAWLEVDLGEPRTFDRVKICERDWNRVRRFELQVREGDAWRAIFEGTTIGAGFIRHFDPVTARHVRLEILEATEGPTIWEFHLYPPGAGRAH